MAKVGLVLEGGAMRGLYTAGVLDVMMENNIDIDGIVGTSAGALFGVNYFSRQKGRAIRYNMKYLNDKRFISKKSLLLTGNIINKDFAFYKVTKELDPLDNQTFIENNKEYYVTATNVETGKPEYFKITDPINQLEELRATSAMPFASKLIELNGKKYLDGGISDSIPLIKCQELGFDKIIVILTQPLDYRKEKISSKKLKLVHLKYKKYPNLIRTMENRHNDYNEIIEKIIDLENKNEIFVIRPSKPLKIAILEKNPEKLEEIYNIGINDCQNIIKDLKEYLNKE
ncbi:MAG: patatin family protein [Bacilli bacterium]|nr:patatin family protein [Bacilli bacterium]